MQSTKSSLTSFLSPLTLCLALALVFTIFATHPAQANWTDITQDSFEAISPTFGVEGGARPIDPRLYVANIIRVILGFLGVIAVCLILFSGFSWMTSRGDSKKIGTAKDTMQAAVIGLVIVLAAMSITVFVTNFALRANDRNANTIMQNY